MSSEKILLIFDFDETIVDQDSIYEQAKMTLSDEDYKKTPVKKTGVYIRMHVKNGNPANDDEPV